MYADPQVEMLARELRLQTGPPPWEVPITELRERAHRFHAEMNPPPRSTVKVETVHLPVPAGDVRCRVHTPEGDEELLPVLVYYHGGGCCTLSPESYGSICTVLAEEAGCIVVAPDYRLAPENPFPAALEDSYAVFEWLVRQAVQVGGDSSRIAVCGDSAGGYLATAVCLEAKRLRTTQPCHQVLVYPNTDMAGKHRSRFAFDDLINDAGVEHMIEMYAGEDRRNPRVSPLHADEHAGLASATIVAAELDPLVDEGKAYTLKLRKAGVPSVYILYEGAIHGFLSMGSRLDVASVALQHIAGSLRHVFRQIDAYAILTRSAE
jgi:acetyl esterase